MRKAWWLAASLTLAGCSSPHRSLVMNPQVPDSYVKALAKEEKVSEDVIRQRLAASRSNRTLADDPKATPGRVTGSRGVTPPETDAPARPKP
ncbi:hypothetical protein K2X85_13860 [bacterium]|jgi:uncharacterized lipoprotein YajG|nr:hypothetical protein [bacterium]